MKKKYLWILVILLFPIVYANDFGYDSQELIIDLNIYSKLYVVPESSRAKLQNVNLFLTYYPRENWQQQILDFTSTMNYQEIDDTLVFTWNEPSAQALSADVRSKVKTKNDLVKIKRKVKFPLTLDSKYQEYIEPTQNIESDDPKIIALASGLVAGYDDEYLAVYEIFSWVKENIDYDLNTLTAKVSQPASWVLKNRYGVCDELSSLFIALVRSVGIPARYISGVAYTNYNDLNTWGAHGWAEVYFPDYGWLPFDVTYGQVGHVDATHIILKKSLDSNDTSLRYEWEGIDVDLRGEPMVIEANLVSKLGSSSPLVQIDLTPVKTKADFGSYNIIKANVKNLKNYYVTTELTLGRTNGLETISAEAQSVVLKPYQEKNVFWLIKIDQDLDIGYVYTFPVNAISTRGLEALTSFASADNHPHYSLSRMNNLLDELKEEESLVYSKNVDIDCSLEKEPFYEYESSKAVCILRNTGNVVLKDLRVCLEQDCRVTTIGISRSESVSFALVNKEDGYYENAVSAKNSQVTKSFTLQYTVLDKPLLEISNIGFPTEVEFNGQYELKFTLSKNSSSVPVNVKVVVESNIPKEWNFPEYEEDNNFVLSFKGGDLSYGQNDVKISATYYDLPGKEYTVEKTITIALTEATFFQRVILFLRQIEYKLLKAINTT